MRQRLGSVDIWASRYKSRPTGYLSVLNRAGGADKMPGLRVWCWVSLYLYDKLVLLQKVVSVVIDRDSL